MIKRNSIYERQDDFNPTVNCDNPIQEKWIHKPVVKKLGDSEDDFIVEEKPVLIDSVNIHKCIQEEAKTTDLKYLLQQLLQTGDESVLNQKPGVFGDFSMFDEGHSLSSRSKIDLNSIKEKLPDEFRKLSDEQIAALTDEDIVKYYQAKIAEFKKQKEEEVKTEEVETEIKKEGD